MESARSHDTDCATPGADPGDGTAADAQSASADIDHSEESFLHRKPGVVRRPPPTKFAAIDVGTNSIHLVMVEISPEGDFRIVGRDKEMVQLGKGGFRKHILTEQALVDGVAALVRFSKMARLKGIGRIHAFATSAVREARNGGDFVERVLNELGMEVRILSVEEEARLIYLAVRHAVGLGDADDLICDIGGGSVEVIVGNARRASVLFSAKLGGLRLAELFLKNDPPSARDLKPLKRHIEQGLAPLARRVGDVSFSRCICTSGSFECMARMCLIRRGQSLPDGSAQMKISRAELKELLAELVVRTSEQKLQMPGMDAKRVSTLVPAATTLLEIGKMFNVADYEFCDMALREGIIIDHIAHSRAHLLARATWPDPRTRSVIELAERCQYHRAHAEQVRRLAHSLFDQLAPLHGLDDRCRELLGFACVLHDIGYLIGHSGHHKHSYYLIRNGGLKGFSEGEIELIANLARYHRKGRPRKDDYSYAHLDRESRRAFKKLIPILRLANALDRTHYSVVRSVTCSLLVDRVAIEVQAEQDSELEIWTARRQAEIFERQYGFALEVSPPPDIAKGDENS
jgi:exopolyphosphatase/guanosine-5'-triphosphate,3'-diphosphate pyrophosphatase